MGYLVYKNLIIIFVDLKICLSYWVVSEGGLILGFFSLRSLLGIWDCYYYIFIFIFIFLQILVQNFFLGFLFFAWKAPIYC